MLNENEREIVNKIRKLKKNSGTHSPSIFSIAEQIPGLDIKIDACFLSNPYATDLFMRFLNNDLIESGSIRKVLEYYPTQNREIAVTLSPVLQVSPKNILLGNGASEIIQAILHRFTKKKLLINLPTFSPYYEFANASTEVVFFTLDKNSNFKLDADEWIAKVKLERPDTVVIINPNNPDGGYIPLAILRRIISSISEVETIILDESFVHFAFESSDFQLVSHLNLFKEFPNVILVKSMAKDFGIAGVRAGYAIMAEEKVTQLLKNGYLWNVSGLAEYFFRLFAQDSFRKEYEELRIKHVKETQCFYNQLLEISEIKAYPSKANFFLLELHPEVSANEIAMELLIRYGIYTRSCEDKLGLKGEFIRIASRTREENLGIIHALKSTLPALHK